MKRILFLAVAAFSGLTLFAQDCSDLFISEYIEGTGNNKGLEFYNPTAEIINLNAYYVARYSNGNNSFESGGITQLQGFIQPYSTHILVNGQTTSTETSPACDPALQELAQQLDHDYPAPTYMNGNDAIALFKDPVGQGNLADFIVLDLFGIIGGGMQPDDEGWASFTDTWVYKNIYENNQIVDRDSVYIQYYIVPEGYYWLPWSANHSLVRKHTVKEGVKTNPSPEFVITQEWDTIPGGANQWDSLGAHYCDCEFATAVENSGAMQKADIYPNPVSNDFYIKTPEPFYEVVLLDASARVIFRKRYGAGKTEEMIRVHDPAPGIYVLKILTGNGMITEKVLMN
ncbi:MAG: lamin tail domain-containing protein [Bacteroidales bacterium]|nr:lamin tail domain-containing protein [Bacteroidales bacterium]MBN2699585.1 lamin tail domain-containing protein [Bacteroidales bacterium]